MKYDGFIYCITNKSMPGIVKIGHTLRTPEKRLREANALQTFKPPDSYEIEFAKKVLKPKEKERIIHDILKSKRINPRQEFFRVTPEEVRPLFEMADGEYWSYNTDTCVNKKSDRIKQERVKKQIRNLVCWF